MNRLTLSRLLQPLVGLSVFLLASMQAHAGVNEMRRNLEPYMKQFSPQICGGAINETLVRGLYRCDGGRGVGQAYVNEAATLVMLTNGRDIVDYVEPGPGAKPVSEEERRGLLADMLRNIRLDQLIHLKQGNGSTRVLLISAFDCPFCIQLERMMAAQGSRLDADIYVLPSTLDASKHANTSTVRNMWCARDNAAVWRQTLTKATGGYFDLPFGSCDRTSQDTRDIETLLAALGPQFARRSYPRMLLGNGQVYTSSTDAAEFATQLADGAGNAFWREPVSERYVSFRVGNRTGAGGDGKKRVTVGLGDLFKRLGGSDDSKKTEKQEGSNNNGSGNGNGN